MPSHAQAVRVAPADFIAFTTKTLVQPLQALLAAPDVLFLITLGLMLFHSPDFHFYSIDRVAFVLLMFIVQLRACVLHQPLSIRGPITLPMSALLVLSFASLMMEPYRIEMWSVFAAKWLVPLCLFFAAQFIFIDSASLHRFETFSLLVLAYLSALAILFAVGAKDLIFPRFILDESLGLHVDRARGPFLQAVANGLSLNLLGLIALNAFNRKRLRGFAAVLFFVAWPMAIAATKTRSVWFSFSGTILILLAFSQSSRVRMACLKIAVISGIALSAVLVLGGGAGLADRLEEREPVTFRSTMYEAGWEMFLEKPLLGWDTTHMQTELERRVDGFHQEQFYFHNTYLEILVQHGLLGIALYAWIVIDLFRVGRRLPSRISTEDDGFLNNHFRSLWPMFLAVYLVNASFAVMNYQFVNGILFTMAGILIAQNRRIANQESEIRG